MTLPPFPVDDVTLDALEHAMGATLIRNEAGITEVVGADFSTSKLLEFLSGYDPTQLEPDVIRALIAEVRRLRGSDEAKFLQEKWAEVAAYRPALSRGICMACGSMLDAWAS